MVVHADAAALADPTQAGQSALEDAVHVPAETSRRLGCDATRVVLRHAGDGPTLDVGRPTRTIPPALRRALQARDRGCRFPGCGVRHAQGHHIHHWANGGPTRLDNLALLCRRHQRAVHEEGYRVERDADGTLAFRTPRGRPIPEVPPSPAVPPDPSHALVAANGARGLAIHARTGTASASTSAGRSPSSTPRQTRSLREPPRPDCPGPASAGERPRRPQPMAARRKVDLGPSPAVVSTAMRNETPSSALDPREIAGALTAFVNEHIMARRRPIEPDDDLAAAGLDSMAFLKILLFIEAEFGFWMPDEDLLEENLASPRSLANYVCRRRGAS